MKTIKLKNGQLRKIVKNALNEISYGTLQAASDKLNGEWQNEDGIYQNIDDVIKSIGVIREFLNRMEDSFTPLHGRQALNYFYDKKNSPNNGIARKCQECLDFIERFVTRKQAQSANFDNALPDKKAEYDSELLKLARQWNGYNGNSVSEFFNTLDSTVSNDGWDSEVERFINSIKDPNLRQYAENL